MLPSSNRITSLIRVDPHGPARRHLRSPDARAGRAPGASGAFDAFSLWFSLGIGLLVLQAGAFLVPGLSLGMALAAIVTGSVLGALLLAAAGVVGPTPASRPSGSLRLALGARGAAIPAVLNAVQLTGWGAFEIIAMRDRRRPGQADLRGLQPHAVDPAVRRPGDRPGDPWDRCRSCAASCAPGACGCCWPARAG
jgi:hypothetical protein